MKFASFVQDGKRQSGVVADDQLHPFEHPVDLLDLIVEGEEALSGAGERALHASLPVPLADARLLPPLQPPTVRDYMTFESHVAGVARGYGDTVPEEWYAAPAFCFTNPYAMVGAHDDVPVPPGCGRFDFELEVAAVIGKAGRDLTPEQAHGRTLGLLRHPRTTAPRPRRQRHLCAVNHHCSAGRRLPLRSCLTVASRGGCSGGFT